MLRAASIGLGWWSDELAGAIQGKSDKLQIASCYSRSPEKRAAFADKFSSGQHRSYETVLCDGDIDAVILTTPHSMHAEHVAEAAAAGKHVFVEKPFTLTGQTAREAVNVCKSAGVTLAIGHNRRFSAAAQHLKEMLDRGEFGTLLHIETNFSAPSATKWTKDHWRANKLESPAGGLAGLGIHMIDLLTWLGGDAVRVTALAKRRALSVDVEDTTSSLFELASGATAYLGTFSTAPYTAFCNIYGTQANAFAAVDGNELFVQRAGEPRQQVPLEPVDTLAAELEEFADACAGKVEYRVRPDEAVHTVAVMEAITRSAAGSGTPTDVQRY